MARPYGTGHYVGNLLFLEQDYDDDLDVWRRRTSFVVDQAGYAPRNRLEDAYNGGYYYKLAVVRPQVGPKARAGARHIAKAMRILLQQKKTGCYLKDLGAWGGQRCGSD